MPDFWQFPTVSMGLGPLMAIYQARFLKYLAEPRPGRHSQPQGLGLHGRRRDGRAGVARRDLARRCARISTIWSSSSTATCSGSTGRCAATARSSRSSKAISAAPAGTSSRCCGARAGIALLAKRQERAAAASAWRSASTASTRTSRAKNGAYVREHFFGKYPELKQHGRRHERRRDLGA